MAGADNGIWEHQFVWPDPGIERLPDADDEAGKPLLMEPMLLFTAMLLPFADAPLQLVVAMLMI